jgi:hypothetical protein
MNCLNVDETKRIPLEKILLHDWFDEKIPTIKEEYIKPEILKIIEGTLQPQTPIDVKINEEVKNKKEKHHSKIGQFKRIRIKFCRFLIKIKNLIEIILITSLSRKTD